MNRGKFEFYDVDNDGYEDYIIWLWKGDYLNLGAGLEMGIYRRCKKFPFVWYVDRNISINMKIKLLIDNKNIIDWNAQGKP